MNEKTADHWPTELRLRKDKRVLTVNFDVGETFDLPAEYLRVKSPSAEVQGHSPNERKTVAGKKDVAILEVHAGDGGGARTLNWTAWSLRAGAARFSVSAQNQQTSALSQQALNVRLL